MKKNHFFWLAAILLFASCESKSPLFFPLEIITDGPISENGKYPAGWGNIIKPYDFSEENFLVPKPIKVRRVDMGNGSVEINAFAFEHMGEPTLELYQNWMPTFFKDSMPSKELLFPKGENATAMDWILKNSDKHIIVFSHDGIGDLPKSENVSICEDEAQVFKKIIELLKANSEEKIIIVMPSAMESMPVATSLPSKIETYKKTLEIEHDDAKTWQELYNKAEQFILTNEEHEYDHPSAYCYVICAAEKAIETGKTEEMYSQMRLDCPNSSYRSKNICRLKEKAHEHIWNKVLAGLKTKDSEALEVIEEKLMSDWITHLKGEEAETAIEKFETQIEHTDAKNWQELYYKSAEFLLSEEEHAYDHPSAYCYLVCAAEKAIEMSKTSEMIKAMENVCSNSHPQSKNLCKLKSGHEKNWNAIISSLEKSDSKALEELEEGIMSRWLAHLKSS